MVVEDKGLESSERCLSSKVLPLIHVAVYVLSCLCGDEVK